MIYPSLSSANCRVIYIYIYILYLIENNSLRAGRRRCAVDVARTLRGSLARDVAREPCARGYVCSKSVATYVARGRCAERCASLRGGPCAAGLVATYVARLSCDESIAHRCAERGLFQKHAAEALRVLARALRGFFLDRCVFFDKI